MISGMFGLFGAAGLIVWFGSRIGRGAASVVALGWPALFLALGYNFLVYAFQPPDGEATPVWGWLIPGALFWLIGAAPVAVGLAAWRQARAGRTGNRLSQQVVTSVRSQPIIFGRPAAAPSAHAGGGPTRGPIAEAASWVGPRSAATSEGGGDADPDLVDDLGRLARMHAAGDLTDEEFSAAKLERLTEPGTGR
jgi:hypothetical protein